MIDIRAALDSVLERTHSLAKRMDDCAVADALNKNLKIFVVKYKFVGGEGREHSDKIMALNEKAARQSAKLDFGDIRIVSVTETAEKPNLS